VKSKGLLWPHRRLTLGNVKLVIQASILMLAFLCGRCSPRTESTPLHRAVKSGDLPEAERWIKAESFFCSFPRINMALLLYG